VSEGGIAGMKKRSSHRCFVELQDDIRPFPSQGIAEYPFDAVRPFVTLSLSDTQLDMHFIICLFSCFGAMQDDR